VEKGKSFSSIGLLHLTCCCPDSPLLRFSRGEVEDIELFASSCQDELIMSPDELSHLQDYMLNLSIMKTTMLLNRWIDEEKEEMICDQFNIGPGDVYRQTESTRWLLHATIVFADLLEFRKLTVLISDLEKRVRYGIKEELVELTNLKGVGRVRGRNLFHKGYKTLSMLKRASLDDIAAVPQIGKTLAREIMDQLTGKSKARNLAKFVEEKMELL
jgi:helicase